MSSRAETKDTICVVCLFQSVKKNENRYHSFIYSFLLCINFTLDMNCDYVRMKLVSRRVNDST